MHIECFFRRSIRRTLWKNKTSNRLSVTHTTVHSHDNSILWILLNFNVNEWMILLKLYKIGCWWVLYCALQYPLANTDTKWYQFSFNHSFLYSFFSLFMSSSFFAIHFSFCFASNRLLHFELFAVTTAGTICCIQSTIFFFPAVVLVSFFFMDDINRCWVIFRNLLSIDGHVGTSRAPKQYATNNNNGLYGNGTLGT